MPIVSNTGPLISACQSQSVSLLASLFDEVHIPSGVMTELVQHGWGDAISPVANFREVGLTPDEQVRIGDVSRQVAEQSRSGLPMETHHGEAEAIILAQRQPPNYDVILLDERSAREVARQLGLTVVGFAGVLVLAVKRLLISPDEVRVRLEQCRQQGTHYSQALVDSMVACAETIWRQT